MSAIFDAARAEWRDMHEAWLDVSAAEFDAAEAATRGVMLSRLARTMMINERDLWHMNAATAASWGSEELNAWLRDHPRTTLEQFENQWVRERREEWAA